MGRTRRFFHVASVLGFTLFCVSACSSKRGELFNSPLLPGSASALDNARGTMSEGKEMIEKGEQQMDEAEDLLEQAEELRYEADQLDERAEEMLADGKRLKKRGKARIRQGEQALESVEYLEKAERIRRKGEALKPALDEG
jgi:hypothetical protein